MTQKKIDQAEKELILKTKRKPVFADEKPNYHRNKFLGGIFKISLIVVFLNKFGIHWNEKATPFLKEFFIIIIGEQTGNFLALAIIATAHVFMLVMLIKGIYQVLTYNQYIDEYEGKNLAGYEISQTHNIHGVPYSNSNISNINKVYAYRNSKMAGMTPEKAAELYINTSKLGRTSNKQMEGYINSKLGGMTPDKGLNYLKGMK